MPNQYWAEVISHVNLVDEFWLLTVKNKELAREAKPGQFLHVKVSPGLTPLLRRPISIHDVEGDQVKILYQVVGEGTRLLTKFKQGDKIDIMGPIGNGFNLEKLKNNEPNDNDTKEVAVVAGGIGIAPLYYLVRELVEAGQSVVLYQGGRSERFLLGKEFFENLNLKYKIATDDGSQGHQGLVTDLLQKDLEQGSVTEIYACGPHLMLKSVAKLAGEFNVPSQVSLEERMGCGTGACLSCVCKIKVNSKLSQANSSGTTYKKVCVDGPVFDGQEVNFDEA